MTMSAAAQTAGLVARLNKNDPASGMGNEINRCKNLMKCKYDCAVQNGAAGTYSLLDDQGNAAVLPIGAVVTNVFVYVLTAPTTCTSIAFRTALNAADLMAATAIASLTVGIFWKGIPVEPLAAHANTTAVGPTTAASTALQITIAGSTEPVGAFRVLVEYMDIN